VFTNDELTLRFGKLPSALSWASSNIKGVPHLWMHLRPMSPNQFRADL